MSKLLRNSFRFFAKELVRNARIDNDNQGRNPRLGLRKMRKYTPRKKFPNFKPNFRRPGKLVSG